MKVADVGDFGSVMVYLSRPLPNGAKWYKYDVINGWQDYSAHVRFTGDRKSVVLELKDGDYGDCDGIANRIIVDPSGPGTATAPAWPNANDGGGGGCFIGVVSF